MGPNRLSRIMREDNLLCVRKRKLVATTDSNHGRKVYPNLKSAMELSGINQLGSPTSPARGSQYASHDYTDLLKARG